MRNTILFRNFIFFTFIMMMCVAGLGYHVFSSAEDIRAIDNKVNHTQSVIKEVQGIINIVNTVMTQQRRLAMFKETDQEAYEKAKADMSTQVGTVKVLVADNPVQSSRMTEIEHLSLKLKDELDSVIAAHIDSDSPPIKSSSYDQVVKVRDNMYRLSNDMLEEEYKLLGSRERTVELVLSRYQASMLIGGVVACLIILIFNWYLLQAYTKINLAEKNMQDSEERMRLAIRGSNDGIFDWNLKTHEIYWSSQYKTMLGYDDGEIKGDEDTFRKLLHDEDSEIFWETFNNYINGNMSEFSCIFRMVHKSGRDVWIHGRGKALFDENGNPQRFIGAHTDITYIKEYERQLREEKERAEAASEAKGEFLAHMSHEIRTPLTAVSGIAEIFMQTLEKMDEKHQKLVKTLKTSTETLKELITDILDFSKIESGEVELHMQKFQLNELFEQVVSITSVKANERALAFNVDYSGLNNTTFNGDKQRLRQILINLIGNAIKFTEVGSVDVSARIEAIDHSHILRVDIKDTGIGIPETAIPVIFEKFRQADSSVSRRYGGTGLGLPISKSLAEIMGGVIKVESEVGKGSTFTLILPFTSLASETPLDMGDIIKRQKLDDRLRTAIGGKKKILLVEDYEGNIVVMSYILNELECAFDVAKTGLEAIHKWKENHYDLILMDIQMPEMDGLTATKTIRKMEEEQGLANVPIVGLTAHALVADKQKCIDAGMDSYLSKPIVEDDLKGIILSLLEKEPASGGKRASYY